MEKTSYRSKGIEHISPSEEEKKRFLRKLITQGVNQQFYQFYQGFLKNISLQ